MPDASLPALTEREREVLEAIASGSSNRQVAVNQRISSETVKSHVRAIFQKLQARSRTQAVLIGLAAGLISLPPALHRSLKGPQAESRGPEQRHCGSEP